jgi:hypothetical protein
VEEQNNISHILWQRCVTEFCVKLGKSGDETSGVTECIWNRSNELSYGVWVAEAY